MEFPKYNIKINNHIPTKKELKKTIKKFKEVSEFCGKDWNGEIDKAGISIMKRYGYL